jgi:hypothetical protein
LENNPIKLKNVLLQEQFLVSRDLLSKRDAFLVIERSIFPGNIS